ncbi:MAG: hypothetical protein K6F45_04380 [Saccharofermentans sp.]|nr:hypothetical protein [Saccharofermentans sp.]
MNYLDFIDYVKDIDSTGDLEFFQFKKYTPAYLKRVVSDAKIIKIPRRIIYRGNDATVGCVFTNSFIGNTNITDIICTRTNPVILHNRHYSGDKACGAFAGCTSLQRSTIPVSTRKIVEGTFAGCESLTDVYYEGSYEDWKKIEIVSGKRELEFGGTIPGTPVQQLVDDRLVYLPGNEALLRATVHFNCDLSLLYPEDQETGCTK